MIVLRSEASSYRALAAAIIQSAVDDRKLTRRRMKGEEYQGIVKQINVLERFLINDHDISGKDITKIEKKIKELKGQKALIEEPFKETSRFFKSEWFEALSDFLNMNPDYMRDKLKAM
jgi:hypothetical protein